MKVDISNSGRPLTEGLDPAFTDWATTQNWFTGGNTTSRTFDGVTVTFTRTGSVGTALKPGYWKAGVQSSTYNVKLTADGIKVDTPDAAAEAQGSQIEMRIAGLTAGPHTLLLYLNNWDGTTSVAPLDILVNGIQVVNDLAVSTQVTDNNLATTSYLNLTAVAGQDVVVLIKAETSGSQTSKNVHINGFEIDVPNVKAQANNPVPDNADEHFDADTGSLTLGWGTATLGAASHNVYFGTAESAVSNATTASPEFKGNQTGNTYPVSGINPHLTYYWRIDEVASNGAVTKGNVWYFRPRRLAFPGAEGYGRFARGGRGGVVVKVTNLNDSGSGSLRDAIEGNYGPRTVVFDVSGLITLSNDIIIDGTRPYITVAGQTAPGKGICIKRQQFAMSGARDVNFRFIRGLVGKESGETQNATGMAGVDHCIMDHCSFGWGIDEELSSRGGKNHTFQRSLIAEALNIAGHQNYPAGQEHGYAATISGKIGSYHYNLLAHNEGRNWSMGDEFNGSGGATYSSQMDISNNVVYNWGGRTTDGTAHEVNFVGNYYKPTTNAETFVALTAQLSAFDGTQMFYFSGNVMPGKFDETNQTVGRAPTSAASITKVGYDCWATEPLFPAFATIDTATNAYKKVLSDVGCNLPMLDNRDTRVITETLNGTTTYTGSISGKKGIPDTTNDVGGWENYGNETRPAGFDTDNDGMPDWWESIKGLSNSSPAGDFTEANADPDGNGYTNLEDYLNWMALPHADCAVGSTIDIDLQALSMGYSKTSPVYTFLGPVGGTVSVISGRYARFTPTTTTNALGSFTYKVTDSAGDKMTRTVNVRIIGSGVGSPPAAPTSLNAAPGTGQVSLSWTPSAGAGSYIVKRSTLSGASYIPVASLSGTTFTDTGLTGGRTYYYVVSAVSGGGESKDSTQSSATLQASVPSIPPAPTGLTATAGNAQASLSWAASSGATNYNIKRSTTSGSGYTTIASSSGTSYVNSGLTNGITYYYVVSAVNSGGESANSAQASATPLAPGGGGSSYTIQAESGTAGGGTLFEQGSSSNSGWNGTGYANLPTTGGTLQFNNLNGGTGGTATLAIRFTVGGTSSRTGSLVVNGVSQSITFPGTTAWNNWTILTVSVPLTSGATNTLRFESTGQDLANIDEFTVTPPALPTVTIAASDASAGEYGADQTLGFTITRTGATTAPLSVPLVASGTASSGNDYSGFSNSVSIPIGQANLTLPLTVLADSVSEGSETAIISLGSSANFTAGSLSSASAAIADNPSQGYFFTAVANPAKRGPTDDADADGNANIIEYFMGTYPDNSGSTGVLTIPSVGPGTFKVRYPRAKNRTDVSGGLRWSSNMTQWFTSGQSNGAHTVSFAETVISAPAADPETVEATSSITGPGDVPKIFVRLSVQ